MLGSYLAFFIIPKHSFGIIPRSPAQPESLFTDSLHESFLWEDSVSRETLLSTFLRKSDPWQFPYHMIPSSSLSCKNLSSNNRKLSFPGFKVKTYTSQNFMQSFPVNGRSSRLSSLLHPGLASLPLEWLSSTEIKTERGGGSINSKSECATSPKSTPEVLKSLLQLSLWKNWR